VPDLVNACLDLLVDRECGLWHLTNGEAVSWEELARRAAGIAGVDTRTLQARPGLDLDYAAPRPANSALQSERAMLLPPLDDALERFVKALDKRANDTGVAGESAHYAS
jgi:dTDP-4-dehydrorhamnose reductase